MLQEAIALAVAGGGLGQMSREGTKRAPRKRLALVVLWAAIAVAALTGANAVLASTSLHASQIDADSTTYTQECKGDENLPDGSVLWHFVLVGTTAVNSGELTATFQNAGTVGPQVYDKKSGGVLHWNVITSSDDILKGAVTTADGKILNLSHVCRGGTTPPPDKHRLTVVKYYDANANGVKNAGEQSLEGWRISIGGPGFSGDTYTTFDELVDDGLYGVSEWDPIQTNWVHTTPTSVNATVGPDDAYVEFGNYCTSPSGGLTIGFWSNKNGQKLETASDLAFLSGLNLRNANGSDFNPTTTAQLSTWLLAATAKNMANMLSAQLAGMELNVRNALVDPNAFVLGFGGTVQQLMDAANASLGANSNTTTAGAARTSQEQLKIYLDALNNGGDVVPATPCAFGFAS